MLSNILPEFQSFLVSRKLVPEKNAPYYAHWVSKFMAFSNTREGLNRDLLVKEFLNSLNGQKEILDWQIQQAEQALRLYVGHFLTGDIASSFSGFPQKEQIYFNLYQMIIKTREALRIKHYSYRTERSYIDWVKRFYDYALSVKKKDIRVKGIDSGDVRDFLSYLAVKRCVSSSTQNQAFNALLFLFRDVLNIEFSDLGKTVRAKRGVKLPVVLSIEEVQKLFGQVEGKNLLVLQLLYGSGLRLMELARLRVKDIDFDANLIFVRSGKGDNDRTTILPERAKDGLRLYMDEVKLTHEKDLKDGYGEVYLPEALEHKYPNAAKEWRWQYIFPASNLSVDPRSGKVRRHHINPSTIQKLVKNALIKAGIVKHGSVHTLRHSFATHLLMNGINIREIQELLGHKNIETTMIYTHVVRDMSNAPRSPLDNLYKPKFCLPVYGGRSKICP